MQIPDAVSTRDVDAAAAREDDREHMRDIVSPTDRSSWHECYSVSACNCPVTCMVGFVETAK